MLAGVLLILGAVVLGGRVVGSAGKSTSWLSVTRSLPAGHVLVISDLVELKAHLPAVAARRYFSAAPSKLAGKTLARALGAGELLPADAVAVGGRTATRVLPLLVKAGRAPALKPGDRVDVYVLSTLSGAAARELRILTDVEFVGQDALSSGETSLQVRVSPADAISAIAASQSERLDVVRVEPDPADRPGDPGPSSAPAFAGG